MKDPQKILAFDYGRARIGIALGIASLAEPLSIVQNDDRLWENLEKIIKQHQPNRLVIGVSEQEMARESQEFANQLQEKFNLPITLTDETLSSVEVHSKLAELKKGKQKYKGPIDHYAAAHFLQEYLDQEYE